MRRTVVAGVGLVLASVLVFIVGSLLDLEVESAALLGVGLGGVVALVPDRGPLQRLGGFAAGFVFAWVGYAVRAALVPDATSGRAVVVALVVALCVGASLASLTRLPLWSTLLGAAGFAGAYEYTYDAAPPELASTSLTTATVLLFTVAVGYLAASLATFATPADGDPTPRATPSPEDGTPAKHAADARLDDFMMEKSK